MPGTQQVLDCWLSPSRFLPLFPPTSTSSYFYRNRYMNFRLSSPLHICYFFTLGYCDMDSATISLSQGKSLLLKAAFGALQCHQLAQEHIRGDIW